jgi:hypothetical protein
MPAHSLKIFHPDRLLWRGSSCLRQLSCFIFALVLGCSAGDYQVVYRTEQCGDGIDNNGDGQIDEYCACNVIGATRTYFPDMHDQNGYRYNYSSNSACRSGTQVCQTAPSGSSLWVPVSGQQASSASSISESLCNGIDDNCNGLVDEDAVDALRRPVGTTCFVGNGRCKRSSFVQCPLRKPSPNLPPIQATCGAIAGTPNGSEPFHYAPFKEIDSGIDSWDWDCDGQTSMTFGKYTYRDPNGSGTVTDPTTSAVMLKLPGGTQEPPNVIPPLFCDGSCSLSNPDSTQWYSMADKTIGIATLPSASLSCGTVFRIVKCRYAQTSIPLVSLCQVTDIETWAVFCK